MSLAQYLQACFHRDMEQLPGTTAEDVAREERLKAIQSSHARIKRQRSAEVVAAFEAGWSKTRIGRAMRVDPSIVRAILAASAKTPSSRTEG